MALNAVCLKFLGQLPAACLEYVGDVLQEDQAEDDVLVPGGVDGATEFVGRLPERLGVNTKLASAEDGGLL